jgi:hypothetical protein
MDPFKFLELDPSKAKVHLAGWNGIEDPLDVYFDGRFKEWQEHQSRKNFQRQYILSFVKYPGENIWLFVGVYESLGIRGTDENGYVFYDTRLSSIGKDFIGRLIIRHKRSGRASYPHGENVAKTSSIHMIFPEPLEFSDFSGFKEVLLKRTQLELLFKHQYPSWKSALSSVAGVYLISNRNNGMLYVGSAYGDGGIWERWAIYANNYHGGNKSFCALYAEHGKEAFRKFEYSILETCDIESSSEQVVVIESRWKKRLLTREFGYNKN